MILFDESHEQFCTVSGKKKRKPYTQLAEKAGNMQPCLHRDDFLRLLPKSDTLVLAEPHVYFSRREIEGILGFVEKGGGLLLIGNHSNTPRYYTFGCNEVLNPIATLFGMRFNDDEIFFNGANTIQDFIPHKIFEGISSVFFWRGCSLSLTKNEDACIAAFARMGHSRVYSARPAVMCLGGNKVFGVGDSSVWSNPRAGLEGDGLHLGYNVLRWCGKT